MVDVENTPEVQTEAVEAAQETHTDTVVEQPTTTPAAAGVDVEALQARLAEAEENARKWAEYQESQKTEQEKMAEKLAALEANNVVLCA